MFPQRLNMSLCGAGSTILSLLLVFLAQADSPHSVGGTVEPRMKHHKNTNDARVTSKADGWNIVFCVSFFFFKLGAVNQPASATQPQDIKAR